MLLMSTQPNEPLRLVDRTGRWRSLNFPSGALLVRYPLLDWCPPNSPPSASLNSHSPGSSCWGLPPKPLITSLGCQQMGKGSEGRTEKYHPEHSRGCLNEKRHDPEHPTNTYMQRCATPTQKVYFWTSVVFLKMQCGPLSFWRVMII